MRIVKKKMLLLLSAMITIAISAVAFVAYKFSGGKKTEIPNSSMSVTKYGVQTPISDCANCEYGVKEQPISDRYQLEYGVVKEPIKRNKETFGT